MKRYQAREWAKDNEDTGQVAAWKRQEQFFLGQWKDVNREYEACLRMRCEDPIICAVVNEWVMDRPVEFPRDRRMGSNPWQVRI